jgi:hypothetical protein
MPGLASLFMIGKAWKQSSSLSVGEWTNKLRYNQMTENYSIFKKELSSNGRH